MSKRMYPNPSNASNSAHVFQRLFKCSWHNRISCLRMNNKALRIKPGDCSKIFKRFQGGAI